MFSLSRMSAEPRGPVRAPRRGLLVALASFALLCGTACGPRPPAQPAPHDVLRDYLAALERGDPDGAYGLLDPQLRRGLDRAAYADFYAANRAELVAQARAAVEAVGAEPAELSATVRAGGQEFELQREGAGWRVAEPVWPRPVDATAADALRTLHAALARGDLAWARERLLSARAQAAMQRFLAELAAACSAVPDDGGTGRVEIALDGGGSVTLLREEGGWRVDSLVWGAP